MTPPTGTRRWRKRSALVGERQRRGDRRIARHADAGLGARSGPGGVRAQLRRDRRRQLASAERHRRQASPTARRDSGAGRARRCAAAAARTPASSASSKLARDLRRDLVLDGDMRPPAARVLRAEQAVEAVGELVADRVEVVRDDAEATPPPRSIRPAIVAARRRPGGQLRRGGARTSLLGRRRQRMEHGEMRRQLVALGREMAAAQARRARRNPAAPSSAVTISAPFTAPATGPWAPAPARGIASRRATSRPSRRRRAHRSKATRRRVSPTPATPPSETTT